MRQLFFIFAAAFLVAVFIYLAYQSNYSSAGIMNKRLASSHERKSSSSSLVTKRKFSSYENPYGCTLTHKRLAVYQGKWWHTEVFGFLLDYAKRCDHSITIYHSENHPTSALPLYTELFNPVTVRGTDSFRSEFDNYDAVFLTTPDDNLDEEFRKRNANRMIYCAHLTHPKFLHRWHVLRLYMTPLSGWPYVVQVYEGKNTIIPSHERTKEIIMIGTVFDGENYNVNHIYEFANKINKDNWKFVACTRYWKSTIPKPENVEMVMEASTATIYERIRKASYVLIFPSDSSWYHTDRITGALPLAVSVGTPIVTTQIMSEIYGINSNQGILYGNNPTELSDSMLSINDSQYTSLVKNITRYRRRLIRNNVAVIEMVMKGIPSMLPPNMVSITNEDNEEDIIDMNGIATPILPLADSFTRRIIPQVGCEK